MNGTAVLYSSSIHSIQDPPWGGVGIQGGGVRKKRRKGGSLDARHRRGRGADGKWSSQLRTKSRTGKGTLPSNPPPGQRELGLALRAKLAHHAHQRLARFVTRVGNGRLRGMGIGSPQLESFREAVKAGYSEEYASYFASDLEGSLTCAGKG